MLKRCLLSGVDLRERRDDETFVEKLLGNSDRDRFCFGFKAWFLPGQKKNADENGVVFFVYQSIIYIYMLYIYVS